MTDVFNSSNQYLYVGVCFRVLLHKIQCNHRLTATMTLLVLFVVVGGVVVIHSINSTSPLIGLSGQESDVQRVCTTENMGLMWLFWHEIYWYCNMFNYSYVG